MCGIHWYGEGIGVDTFQMLKIYTFFVYSIIGFYNIFAKLLYIINYILTFCPLSHMTQHNIKYTRTLLFFFPQTLYMLYSKIRDIENAPNLCILTYKLWTVFILEVSSHIRLIFGPNGLEYIFSMLTKFGASILVSSLLKIKERLV